MTGMRRIARPQRLAIVNAMLLFAIGLVVLQLWLLTATVNAYLGGDVAVAVPAAIASAVCLVLNLGLLRYLYRLESPGTRD